MLGATLALAVVVLGASPSADPSALVLQLGSPRFALRETAGADLARIGRAALPALRAAKGSPDPEVRLRVAALLARIEALMLREATPIALDFVDVPVGRAVREIDERSGLGLTLEAEGGAAFADRRVTLRHPRPLPFWEGIDALCEAGRLHHRQGGQAPPGGPDGVFTLYDGPAPGAELHADSGPFRVLLTHVHYQSEVDLSEAGEEVGSRSDSSRGPGRPLPAARKQSYLQLLVLAEPRLAITQNGAARLTSAIDDRGQSLVPGRESAIFQHSAGYFGMNPSPTVRARVDLTCPDLAGHRIRLIKGTIPVQVAARRPDPLEIPLAGGIGRWFRAEEATIAVREVRPARDAQAPTIDVSIRPIGPALAPIAGGEGEPLAYRADSPQQQIEILDARGRALPWFPSGTFADGEETRLTLTVLPRGDAGVPSKIRYHELLRGTADVPFEFRDVPMP